MAFGTILYIYIYIYFIIYLLIDIFFHLYIYIIYLMIFLKIFFLSVRFLENITFCLLNPTLKHVSMYETLSDHFKITH